MLKFFGDRGHAVAMISETRTSCIVVVPNGYRVLEKYYRGNKDTLRDLYSMTKSVISALFGIAISKNDVSGKEAGIVAIYSLGAIGRSLSTRDMAKFGYLYLRGGRGANGQGVPRTGAYSASWHVPSP